MTSANFGVALPCPAGSRAMKLAHGPAIHDTSPDHPYTSSPCNTLPQLGLPLPAATHLIGAPPTPTELESLAPSPRNLPECHPAIPSAISCSTPSRAEAQRIAKAQSMTKECMQCYTAPHADGPRGGARRPGVLRLDGAAS